MPKKKGDVTIEVPTGKVKGVGGSKLGRTEVVTVRFDPKLRYALELGARRHRRSISNLIECAVEKALAEIDLPCGPNNESLPIPEAMEGLWDVDEADRLVKLACQMPDLLTYDEERIWKIINENRDVFGNGVQVNLLDVRKHWPALKSLTWQREG